MPPPPRTPPQAEPGRGQSTIRRTEPTGARPAWTDVFAAAARWPAARAAAAYAAAGVAVFPCAAGAKRPLTRHGYLDASADPVQVGRWWRRWPDANVGLPTGRAGGFDVLDVDVHPSGSGFPALARARRAGLTDGWTLLMRTPSGGLHLYFPTHERGSQDSWALPQAHVDFRGVGGYVIAPPSRVLTDDGHERGYRLIASGWQSCPLDAIELRRLLTPEPRRPSPRVPMAGTGRGGERLAAWLAGQPEGNRNRALFWAACRQAEAGIPEDQANDVLGPVAARIGLGEREIETTLASAYRALGRRPAPTATAPCRAGP